MTRDERGRDRQLGGSQAERLARELFADAFHFVEHLAGLDFGDPVFRVAFTVTHQDFGRLLRDRLIRENADTEPAAPPDLTVDGTPPRPAPPPGPAPQAAALTAH